MSFIDFAAVKARCSIEQAAKLIGLQTTEERSQLRTPCPVCGGGPRAIVITPLKNLFHCFPSKAGGDQIALVSHVKGVGQKDAAACPTPELTDLQPYADALRLAGPVSA